MQRPNVRKQNGLFHVFAHSSTEHSKQTVLFQSAAVFVACRKNRIKPKKKKKNPQGDPRGLVLESGLRRSCFTDHVPPVFSCTKLAPQGKPILPNQFWCWKTLTAKNDLNVHFHVWLHGWKQRRGRRLLYWKRRRLRSVKCFSVLFNGNFRRHTPLIEDNGH